MLYLEDEIPTLDVVTILDLVSIFSNERHVDVEEVSTLGGDGVITVGVV